MESIVNVATFWISIVKKICRYMEGTFLLKEVCAYVFNIFMRIFFRNHKKEKEIQLLSNVLKAWHESIKQEIQVSVQAFSKNLNKSHNSENYLTLPGRYRGSLPCFSYKDTQQFSANPGVWQKTNLYNNPSKKHSKQHLDFVNGHTLKDINDQSHLNISAYTIDTEQAEEDHHTEEEMDISFDHKFSSEGYIYDSEYKADTTWFDNSAKDFDFPSSVGTFSECNSRTSNLSNQMQIESKRLSTNIPKWTDHWKQRFNESQEKARTRRISHGANSSPFYSLPTVYRNTHKDDTMSLYSVSLVSHNT